MSRKASGENPTSGSTFAPQVVHIVSSATGSVAGSRNTKARRTARPARVSRRSREENRPSAAVGTKGLYRRLVAARGPC